MRDLDLPRPRTVDPDPDSLSTLDPHPVRTLGDFLYPEPAPRRVGAIFRWWEGRRLAFNLMMLPAGLVTLGVATVLTNLPPFGPLAIPRPDPELLQASLVYALIANACYLLGPMLESAALLLFGRSVLPVGPTLYRMGLTFSLGLTLLPAFVLSVVWVVKTVLVVTGLG